VKVATETANQMETRLLQVLAQARFEILVDDYIWQPLAGGAPPSPEAIACVRDGDIWHEFVPSAADSTAQRYRVVSFHFNEAVDAAGFVAWLAAHLKRSAGTGAVVICGKDKRDSAMLFRASQGVFDYWCCSVEKGQRFISVIQSLIDRGQKCIS